MQLELFLESLLCFVDCQFAGWLHTVSTSLASCVAVSGVAGLLFLFFLLQDFSGSSYMLTFFCINFRNCLVLKKSCFRGRVKLKW